MIFEKNTIFSESKIGIIALYEGVKNDEQFIKIKQIIKRIENILVYFVMHVYRYMPNHIIKRQYSALTIKTSLFNQY